MPFRDLIKYVFMAKRQGYYIARCAMIKNGYGLQEVTIMLVHRLLQIEEEQKMHALINSRFTSCKENQFPALCLK